MRIKKDSMPPRACEYESWAGMIQRCTNPNHVAYHIYGGRGITVCDRWKTYSNFLEDMGRKPSKKHTIDRINNDLGYFSDNCRWATRKEQANNRRGDITKEDILKIRNLYKNGKTQKEISSIYNVHISTISRAIGHKNYDKYF